jgi:uncharacterized surface anchored protein
MTRTDVMASSRPRTAGATSNGRGSRLLRGLVALPAVLVLALALTPGVAAAATEEPTSGYTTPSTTTTSTEPTSGYTTPSTTTTAKSEIKPSTTPTTTSPSTGTLPSKESEEPKTTPVSEPAASNTSTTPKSSTLPFTGFDLRWDVGFGLLLLVAGFSIVAIQRRQRRDGGR